MIDIMTNYLILMIFIFFNGGQEAETSDTHRKFVYQKDMSEFCRRSVVPSVFLGRHIVDANSKMLYFSRLEVPYSCNINVRTDMGSNIIVVIQVFTDVDLKKVCSEGDSQLLIYELSETFGGYWGQVPDSVMKTESRTKERQYTLAPTETERTTTTTESTTTETTSTTNATKPHDEAKDNEDQREYISVELPIVNVSALLLPGEMPNNNTYTTQDNFDFIYDVTPGPDAKYDTQMLPLIEVSVQKPMERQGLMLDDNNPDDANPEIPVQFEDLFTPDSRLMFQIRSPKRKSKYQPSVNTHINFKKNKQLFAAKEPSLNKKRLFKLRPQTTKLYDQLQLPTLPHVDRTDYKNNSWDIIKDILKNLTNSKEMSTEPPHKELANIMRGIAMQKFNKSVYLNPIVPYYSMPTVVDTEHNKMLNLSLEHPSPSHFLELHDTLGLKSVSQGFNKSSNRSNVLGDDDSAINNDGASAALLPLAHDVDSIILNGTNENTVGVQNNSSEAPVQTMATTSVKKLDPVTVSLVNHESWENVVNVAPIMADKLNENVTSPRKKQDQNVSKMKFTRGKQRKRRYIHAIDIEIASPHHKPGRKHFTTTPPLDKFDMKDFQRLIELQDDEIHGRMSMRYLKQFVGVPLLRLCDFNETLSRHVYLFNSSRLVLSLTNFTLNRMMIVVTPARTLMNSEARCAPAHLECQVSGARVCIDAHSACDGVPNCGSYDIYDEDRLNCGGPAGLQHNVCLAAFTFLAVLFTVLYTIHYWLKRCIPKVSDAFFIYTDAAENILYLEPLMRSPHDIGGGKQYYPGVLQAYMDYEEMTPKTNYWKIYFKKFYDFIRCRRRRSSSAIVESELDNLYPPRLRLSSTFAELELNKTIFNAVDVGVQTNPSLELGTFDLTCNYDKYDDFDVNIARESVDHMAFIDADLGSNDISDDISLLHFFRRERLKSTVSYVNRIDDGLSDMPELGQEKEIRSYEYIHDDNEINQGTKIGVPSGLAKDEPKKPDVARKHLRFREEALEIPPPIDEEFDDIKEGDAPATGFRRSIMGAGRLLRLHDANDYASEGDEPSGGAGREFKSYFNWGKEKKKKKPKKK